MKEDDVVDVSGQLPSGFRGLAGKKPAADASSNTGPFCNIRVCTGRPKGSSPGSAGVPPASLCLIPLAGAELSSGAEGCRPVGDNLNGQTEADPWRRSGSIRVPERAKAVPDMVRAGRPRSRVGILHTINRQHRLHHAQESGKTPHAGLKNHSLLEGESTRAPPAVDPEGANATSRGSQPFPLTNPAH